LRGEGRRGRKGKKKGEMARGGRELREYLYGRG